MSASPPLRQYDEKVGLPFDPLRLCVFTTIALLTCVFGPLSLLVFALVAIRGYDRARRAGLTRSRCKLGDTRVVLAYLIAVAGLAVATTPFWVWGWVTVIRSMVGG